MTLRIHDMQAVLRLENCFDIGSFDYPSNDAKIDLFRLNEAQDLARNDVPEIENDIRPLLAIA
jgi:hypothetical protein